MLAYLVDRRGALCSNGEIIAALWEDDAHESYLRSLKKDLLDALHGSGLSGILIERAINFSLTDAVMPRRFLPEDSEEMKKQITMFGVCGLLSMVLNWHQSKFASSARELSVIAARLLGKPLFPAAEDFL